MNIKHIYLGVILSVFLLPLYAQQSMHNSLSFLDDPLSGKMKNQMRPKKPIEAHKPGILKEMMFIYKQQSNQHEVDMVIHIQKLEF